MPAVNNSNVYVGCAFNRIGGYNNKSYFAKWDGHIGSNYNKKIIAKWSDNY